MKKLLKRLLLFVLVFLVTTYFIGSCTERPEEYKPKDENSVPEYTELTPDEYQKQMDELVKRPPVTKTSFKSHVLQAHAESLSDKLDNFFDKTGFYDYSDFMQGYWNYLTDKDDGFFSKNDSYPVDPVEPKESVTVPFQYEFYGKNRVVYNNGTYEIIECRIFTTGARSDGKKTGSVKYTRTNQYHQYTSFSFDISVYSITRSFNSDGAFTISYNGLKSYTQGLTQSFIDNYLCKAHFAKFLGSSKNSLYQFNIKSDVSVPIQIICNNSFYNTYPNVFSISSTVTNDYEFSQSVNNYYINNKYWRFPNVYYNNRAGDKITQNNVSNYNDYGYTYNSVTNSIEFDPDVYADFFDLNIKPQLKLAFEDIFSHFPDIDATYSDDDTTINYNDLITIMHEIQATTTTVVTTTGTYPVMTGDINVNVDVTFPEEFYKKYPALTTEPAFVAENPDVDFALDAPLPVRALKTAGSFITLASNFIEDSGLMPIALMFVSLGLVAMFFL